MTIQPNSDEPTISGVLTDVFNHCLDRAKETRLSADGRIAVYLPGDPRGETIHERATGGADAFVEVATWVHEMIGQLQAQKRAQ